MYTWFTVKVKFDRQGENGLITPTTEPYLVDAISYAEAEKRIFEEVKPYATSGELEIKDIRKTKIAELFYNEGGDKWFRCKINYISIDEDKGIEKKMPQIMMVQASDFKNAVDTLIERMKGTLGEYEIASITVTNILDVFAYQISDATAAK
ncbi:MAG: DUF4494 domain-containing protein [Paludibacteraceae bacterium]